MVKAFCALCENEIVMQEGNVTGEIIEHASGARMYICEECSKDFEKEFMARKPYSPACIRVEEES